MVLCPSGSGSHSAVGLGSHWHGSLQSYVTNRPLGQPLSSPRQWCSGACTRERHVLHLQVLRSSHTSAETTDASTWLSATTLRSWCCPPLRHPSQRLAAGQAQTLLPAPKGLVASAASEPATFPWEGGSGLGIHSPSPATSHPAVGKGQPPSFPGPIPA